MATASGHQKMKRMESKASHSWLWDSHISPKNNKWLADNLEEMDQGVKRMFKLINNDGDSFAKKAEVYFQKRPELTAQVEEFYRRYRALAERYDLLIGELRKHIPSDLQSQGSDISEISSGLSNHQKEGDESSSSSDSESESDCSLVSNNSGFVGNGGDQVLQRKFIELEMEFREAKEKLSLQVEKNTDGCIKCVKNENSEHLLDRIAGYEQELRLANEKIQLSNEEIQTLRNQLQLAKEDIESWKSKLNSEKIEVSKLQESITRLKDSLSNRDQEIMNLTILLSEQKIFAEKLQITTEISGLVDEKTSLEKQLREWEPRRRSLEEETRKIKAEKTEIGEMLYREIEQLKGDIAERDDHVEDLKGSLNSLRSDREGLYAQVHSLKADVISRDNQIDEMRKHLEQLHMEHMKLIVGDEEAGKLVMELRLKAKKMEEEIERQRAMILEGAEEKREAIRQLCFSLEHYRNGYVTLRKAFLGHKGVAVLAS